MTKAVGVQEKWLKWGIPYYGIILEGNWNDSDTVQTDGF